MISDFLADSQLVHLPLPQGNALIFWCSLHVNNRMISVSVEVILSVIKFPSVDPPPPSPPPPFIILIRVTHHLTVAIQSMPPSSLFLPSLLISISSSIVSLSLFLLSSHLFVPSSPPFHPFLQVISVLSLSSIIDFIRREIVYCKSCLQIWVSYWSDFYYCSQHWSSHLVS